MGASRKHKDQDQSVKAEKKDTLRTIIDKLNLITIDVLDDVLAGRADLEDLKPKLLVIKEVKDFCKVQAKLQELEQGQMLMEEGEEDLNLDIE